MRRAVDLSRSALGATSPNPPVGAFVLDWHATLNPRNPEVSTREEFLTSLGLDPAKVKSICAVPWLDERAN